MIVRGGILAMIVALGACSGNSEEKMANNAAAANYVPPSVTSRADFGARIERRFHRADANNNDKISADEMPGKNGERRLKRFDTDGNGSLDSTEWGAMMLKQFDRQDANKDGTVTSEERQALRGNRGTKAKRGTRADTAEIDADTDMDAETNAQ